MKIESFLLFSLFIWTYSTSYSQTILSQSVYGEVVDQYSKVAISGANIIIKNQAFEKGTSTNDNGKFSLSEVPVGRYTIFVSHVGYESVVLSDQLIEAGKEKHLTIEMRTATNQLSEVTISDAGNYNSQISNISAYTFTLEQSQRFAGTFYDPGRMALSFPGVTSANDQANNISIRGNAPYTNRWRLEGADIVNPNHLTNAGTFSDRVSVVGGGVNILSAQLMSDTKLLTGAYPAPYGDALGGILDINLRSGNPNHREHTLQVGLLGIDLATEGPFNSSGSSYLVNYRYSTIGLLQSLGVEVSDEDIQFQDLSFNLTFPDTKTGSWNIFGIFGLSSEKFDAEKDSTTWEEEENRISTDFSSNMGAFGVTHDIDLGNASTLKTVAAVSEIQTDREASYMDDSYELIPYQNDEYSQGIFTLSTTLNHKTKKGNGLSAGFIYDRVFFDVLSKEAENLSPDFTTYVDSNSGYNIFKAFGEWSALLGEKFRTQIGVHALYFDLNDNFSIEPRVGLEYFADQRSKITFNYGLTSQSHFPQVYFVTSGDGSLPNRQLDLTKSHQFNLAYSYNINANTLIKLEGFYQKHFNVPVSADISSTFSLLNAVDAFINNEELVNKGEGENKGIELLINRNFVNGYYFMLSSSLYDARYSALDGIKRNTRYDGDYAFTFTGGKEFHLLNKGKNRIFGINVRAFWQGGYRHTPIDIAASEAAGRTVYDQSEAFTLKYKDYFRTDLRLYFKKNKPKYTRTLAFDIQNLTGRQNIGYEYYDTYLNKIVTKDQLGLLPFISYRIEF